MNLYNAYRRGLINLEQYNEFLSSGYNRNSIYNTELVDPIILPSISNYVTGISTEVLTEILSCDTQWSTVQNIFVTNIHSTNSLYVSVDYYIYELIWGNVIETILPAASLKLHDEDAITQITVKVRDGVLGQHASYNAVVGTN